MVASAQQLWPRKCGQPLYLAVRRGGSSARQEVAPARSLAALMVAAGNAAITSTAHRYQPVGRAVCSQDTGECLGNLQKPPPSG
jgi:hypothetical protein